MKGKKILPLVCCIFLLAAAALWFQDVRQRPTMDESSPEAALQEALRGNQDPVEAISSIVDVVSGNIIEIPELLQGLRTENASADTAGIFSIEEIPLHNLYAEPGRTVRFRIFHPNVSEYAWEYYDMQSRKWLQAKARTGEELDELGRQTVYADFVTPEEQPELMIRCIYENADTGEQASEIAYLRALPQKLSQLALADNIMVEAGKPLAAYDTSVEITYMDGTSDTITGLYGLYFMESEIESETTEFTSVHGVLAERKVQTVLNRYLQYRMISNGEAVVTLAYIPDEGAPQIQLSGTITGTDEEPPEISMVDILDKEKIPDSEEESLTILITAEDNVTPYPGLQYAVVQKDTDIAADDINIEDIAANEWFSGPKATVTLRGNSAWFLGCRDQAGNVSFYKYGEHPENPANLAGGSGGPPETETDTQAPVIRNIYVEAE